MRIAKFNSTITNYIINSTRINSLLGHMQDILHTCSKHEQKIAKSFCEFCLVFAGRLELWRHHKSCKSRKNGMIGSVQASELLLIINNAVTGASKELQLRLIDKMRLMSPLLIELRKYSHYYYYFS